MSKLISLDRCLHWICVVRGGTGGRFRAGTGGGKRTIVDPGAFGVTNDGGGETSIAIATTGG